jgi:hypothetical protein
VCAPFDVKFRLGGGGEKPAGAPTRLDAPANVDDGG